MFFIMCVLVGAGGFFGWIVGVNCNLLIQLGTITLWLIYLNSWHVREKELGQFVDIIPFVAYIAGLMVANVAYMLKYGMTEAHFLNSILPSLGKLISL